ncbi:MAG: hypothetical protein RLZZ609_3056 [Cyanobacteriota bacterium]
MPAVVLTACAPTPEAIVEPPLPKLPTAQSGSVAPLPTPALAPLASQQQVVRAVDVGRPDPFAPVLSARLIPPPVPRKQAASPGGLGSRLPPLEPPPGLVFQGVLQGPMGQEALVEYAPSESNEGVRSGSLRVGDMGTGKSDALLPPGWRVRAIDVAQGVLVLQSGNQSVNLQL